MEHSGGLFQNGNQTLVSIGGENLYQDTNYNFLQKQCVLVETAVLKECITTTRYRST
jgi:shikimate kinase